MSKIKELLDARRLPALEMGGDPDARRLELVRILSENIYGVTPDFQSEVTVDKKLYDRNAYGGKAQFVQYLLNITTPGGDFKLPLTLLYPKTETKVPLIVNVRFNIESPSGTAPDEEIIDRGAAIAKIYYGDVSLDADDGFSSGAAPLFPRPEGCRTNWGKIGMWAWAASRALDYLLTLDMFDTEKIAVAGHSRLGKTALWCGAQDTRFRYVFSNNAGCSGDAITRGKVGEQLGRIYDVFPHWFCEKYNDYRDDAIENMPFDQHFLVAAIAPRKVCVGAAIDDTWADPMSEFLCCAAASEAWEVRGMKGFVAPDRLPVPGETFGEGDIQYHLREGGHAMLRSDWMKYIDFMLK
ncbi:MAG: acetylxylan esterase [Ruminococcaceae bacterium]|nr:acetylxylan esterase [Oscillospiraceae bacterium]